MGQKSVFNGLTKSEEAGAIFKACVRASSFVASRVFTLIVGKTLTRHSSIDSFSLLFFQVSLLVGLFLVQLFLINLNVSYGTVLIWFLRCFRWGHLINKSTNVGASIIIEKRFLTRRQHCCQTFMSLNVLSFLFHISSAVKRKKSFNVNWSRSGKLITALIIKQRELQHVHMWTTGSHKQ